MLSRYLFLIIENKIKKQKGVVVKIQPKIL
jgi:hypothetical protein